MNSKLLALNTIMTYEGPTSFVKTLVSDITGVSGTRRR